LAVDADFDAGANLLTITIHGQISAAELVAAYERILADPRFISNMPSVWDLSGISLLKVPASEVRSLPRQLRKFMGVRGDNYRSGLVTTRRADYQLLRIYLSILKLIGRQVHIRLFQTTAEASEWALGE
jgi:hypothetical protein